MISMRIVDLTQTFDGDMPVYPGDPPARLTRIADIRKNGFTDHELTTGLHVGTHMDAPLHMVEGGSFLSDISMERCMGKGHLIDARGKDSVTEELLNSVPVQSGDILLLWTGHSAKFRKPDYYEKFPVISESFALRAVDMGVSVIGMDTPSPDVPPFPIHKILLCNGVLIVENLTNLEALLGVRNFRIIALPCKLQADAAPVRVVAVID